LTRLAVTVFGSGGPFANPRRASSGYLVSVDKVPRILVDAGGGVYERIGMSEFNLATLEQLLLTHMHIDHSSDLPAVIMDLYMRNRERPVALAGPAGNDQPGAAEFIELLFGSSGAWRYMNTFDGFGVRVLETPSDTADPSIHAIPVNDTLAALGVTIGAVGVPHGMMPSVAFRIDCSNESIVFSGDISASTDAIIALAKDCSLLVHDFALPEGDVPNGDLHAKPSAVGRTAQRSGAKMLLLSHFMPPIEDVLPASVEIVRREYAGPIVLANDLQTYELP
jgi:ribonuclease BN (tRNA processing enzyme)